LIVRIRSGNSLSTGLTLLPFKIPAKIGKLGTIILCIASIRGILKTLEFCDVTPRNHITLKTRDIIYIVFSSIFQHDLRQIKALHRIKGLTFLFFFYSNESDSVNKSTQWMVRIRLGNCALAVGFHNPCHFSAPIAHYFIYLYPNLLEKLLFICLVLT